MKKREVGQRKLDIEKIGISGGIFFGVLFLVLTFFGKLFQIFSQPLNILLDVYGKIGYDVSYFGLVLGVVYGFVTGFIFFAFFAWIYNSLPEKI